MVKNIFCVTLLTQPTQVSHIFGVGRGPQIYKIGLETEVTIGGDAAESFKNTHLLVITRMRLLQKIGMFDLKN